MVVGVTACGACERAICTIMPYDISHPVIMRIHREWKKATTKHKSHAVKNKFHQELQMDEWSNELKNINSDFRKRVEDTFKDIEREEAEHNAMEQEEIEMRRFLNREKRQKRNVDKKQKIPVMPTPISKRILVSNWN